MPLLQIAIAIAVEAHRGKTDKGSQPYILHPLCVMLRVAGKDHICGRLHGGHPDVVFEILQFRHRKERERLIFWGEDGAPGHDGERSGQRAGLLVIPCAEIFPRGRRTRTKGSRSVARGSEGANFA